MWYKIGEVEYSTDFKFFLENQIAIAKGQNGISFNSRLESKAFLTVSTLVESEQIKLCEIIHCNLLLGKHGQGELVK